MDYSEMIINEHLIATISTGEIVGVQYKIDDGEWQNYSEQLYITEDCTIYARLTDGTTVYKQVEQEILMPIACTQIGNAATYHTTVQNAINIAGTNPGATVTLLKGEIAETVTVAAGQDMVIYLNGKTWANIGEQTITNNGERLITSSSSYTIINNGTFEKYGNSTI